MQESLPRDVPDGIFDRGYVMPDWLQVVFAAVAGCGAVVFGILIQRAFGAMCPCHRRGRLVRTIHEWPEEGVRQETLEWKTPEEQRCDMHHKHRPNDWMFLERN